MENRFQGEIASGEPTASSNCDLSPKSEPNANVRPDREQTYAARNLKFSQQFALWFVFRTWIAARTAVSSAARSSWSAVRSSYVTSCLTVSQEVSLADPMPWARSENSAGLVAVNSASS